MKGQGKILTPLNHGGPGGNRTRVRSNLSHKDYLHDSLSTFFVFLDGRSSAQTLRSE